MARQLAAATKQATQKAGAEPIELSTISKNHDACARVPRVTGWKFGDTPGATGAYHPNALGQAAAAALLVAKVKSTQWRN
ncbi:MAG TPA: hypothetical protein VNT53_05990 [Pseudolysinimonas sp.]|nr:hypothetical protein [Pseudolysinimonas sp.]